jgi:hypothetical protein
MFVDILMLIDTKEAGMFRKKRVAGVYDNAARAAKLREEMLFKAARLGPRI